MNPLALTLALAAGLLHPNSVSSSRVRVEGEEVHVALRCQLVSLLEVIEGLDANSDESVSHAEVAQRSGDIFGYVTEHYRLWSDSSRDLEDGTPLRAELLSVLLLPPDDAPAPFRDWVDVEVVYRSKRPVEDLLIEITLFLTTSPDHTDFTSVQWSERLSDHFALNKETPRAYSDSRGRGAFRVFFAQGWKHILSGWDHLAFLAALVLASCRLRSLLGVVTAFTVAHSVTLSLATLDVIDASGWSAFIEQAIALSIAYVAADLLIHSESRRARWIEAFAFGLLHGLGFAAFLSESLVLEKSKGLALFSFNLGVEAGQVATVVTLCLLLSLLPRKEPKEVRFLAPRALRRVGATAIMILGLYWFFERL